MADQAGPRQRLFVSQIDPSFDPNRDFVLGPWCFLDRETDHADWDLAEFTDAFETPAELRAASEFTESLVRYHIGRIAVALNRRHGLDHPPAYWWPILVSWVLTIVESTWWYWCATEKWIARHGGSPIEARIAADAETVCWPFRDVEDVHYGGVFTADYNYWILSLCLMRLAPDHWQLEPRAFRPNPTAARNEMPPVRTNPLKRLARNLMPRWPVDSIPGMSAWAQAVLSTWVRLLPPRKGAPSPHFHVLDNPPAQTPARFAALLELVLAATEPAFLGADFARLAKSARGYRYRPGRLYVTCASISNTASNFQLAEAQVAGERVVRVQHGSDYGTMACVNVEALSEYANNAFLTWGWREQGRYQGHFVPVPAPGLSALRERHRPNGDDVLFVGTRMFGQPYRIHSLPQPAQFLRYRRDKVKFIGALDRDTRNRLVYRPYLRGLRGFEEIDFLRRFCGELPIHEADLGAALLRCRLLVLDHPGTTLNNAMAGNVPMVCFWPAELWPLAPQAAPYFDALADAGILHRDPISAARQVTAVFADPQQWWHSKPVRRAHREWANQFARSSPHWMWDWARMLRRL